MSPVQQYPVRIRAEGGSSRTHTVPQFRYDLISPPTLPTKQLHIFHTHSPISTIWPSLQHATTQHNMAHDRTPHPRRHQHRGTLVKPENQAASLHNSTTHPIQLNALALHLAIILFICTMTCPCASFNAHPKYEAVPHACLVLCLHAKHTVEWVACSCLLSERCPQATALSYAHRLVRDVANQLTAM